MPQNHDKPIVGVIMGSDSDFEIMKEAGQMLGGFSIPSEGLIISAHRTPERTFEYAQTAARRGLKVIIAGAGGAAALPGVIASITVLPVIGVPILSKTLSGIDSLYSMVQMPSGVPVATVAINGAKNAALLAARILALSDPTLLKKLLEYQQKLKSQTIKASSKLDEALYQESLKRLL